MKKIILLLLICTMLFSACSYKDINGNRTMKAQANVTDKEGSSLKSNHLTKIVTLSPHLADFTFDLYDWYTNEVTNSASYPNNEILRDYFVLEDGYATLNFAADAPIALNASGKGIKTPEKTEGKIVRLYDSELNVLKEVNLGKFIADIDLADLFTLDVSLNGKKIAWAYGQALFVYDIEKNKLIKIFENSNTVSVDFLKIKFTEEADRIIYYGYISGDNDFLTNYGIVDIEEKDMTNFAWKTKFKAQNISITSNYACIIDEEDGIPPTTSGTVLMIDLKSEKAFDIKVDSFESQMSAISGNEKYLISVIEEDSNIRVRQYSLDSKRIKEQKYKIEDGEFYLHHMVIGEGNTAYILLRNNDATEKYVEFICEEK